MKKWMFVSLLFISMTMTVYSQQETLFSRAHVVGGFGGPIMEWGLNNNLSSSVGGGGGIVIDQFFFGGYGLGSVDLEQLIEEGTVDNIQLGHGGFWLGYSLGSFNVLHAYASGKIGWGAIDLDVRTPNVRYSDLDKVFVTTPEVGLELNLTRWFRVAGAVGYRWVHGIEENNPAIGVEELDGAVISLTLRFGWFGRKYKRGDRW